MTPFAGHFTWKPWPSLSWNSWRVHPLSVTRNGHMGHALTFESLHLKPSKNFQTVYFLEGGYLSEIFRAWNHRVSPWKFIRKSLGLNLAGFISPPSRVQLVLIHRGFQLVMGGTQQFEWFISGKIPWELGYFGGSPVSENLHIPFFRNPGKPRTPNPHLSSWSLSGGTPSWRRHRYYSMRISTRWWNKPSCYKLVCKPHKQTQVI